MSGRVRPRRLWLGVAAVLLIDAGVALALWASLTQLRRAQALVSRTHEIRSAIEELGGTMNAAEGAQRNYVLTGDARYLPRVSGPAAASRLQLRELRARTAGDSAHDRDLATVADLVERRLALLDTTLALRRAAGLDAALTRITTGAGLRMMDSIHAALGAMERREAGHLSAQLDAAEAAATRALIVLGFGAFVALTATLAGGGVMVRSAMARAATDERFAAVFEVQAEGVVIQDARGRVVDGNRAAEQILGLPRALLLRLHEPDLPWQVYHEDGTPAPREQHPAMVTLRTGVPSRNVVLRIRHPDGQWRWLLVNARPLREDERLIGVVSSFSDITRRREAEARADAARDAAERANRAKSEFLASMSHELRTPLNSVIGFAAIMLKNRHGNLREEDCEFLQRIHDNGRHLLGLINNVLDLAKIESGQQELELAAVDLAPLVADVLAQFQPQLQGRDVALVADVPAGLAPLQTDGGKLRQVLINLIGNALKFTERGSVTVRVTAEGGRPAALTVTDTGIGIPHDRQAAVFEPFQQADNTTARRFGGTGLGLSITRSLLERMGYTIRLESEPGRGTSFVVSFQPAPAPAGAGQLVLVVDDDDDARALLLDHLTESGHRVVTAASGAEALRLARELRPALITLDLLMPNMPGDAVLRELQADTVTREIPVVIVSIVAGDFRGKLAGAADIIDKPVTPDAFDEVVRRHLTIRRQPSRAEPGISESILSTLSRRSQ